MGVAELKSAACEYWKQGLPIVLLNDNKQPLHEWKQWQTRKQTEDEFNSLPWDHAEKYAAVCGVQGSNGLFFCAVDADNPDFDKSLVRTTATEGTPKGGYHFIFWSRVNARGQKLHDLKIELLGQGNLCIMFPSKDYAKINDNSPTEINSINEVFRELAEKLGGKTKRTPIDIQKLFEGVPVGARDTSAIQISVYYRKKGLSQQEVLERLTEWNRKNEQPLEDAELEKTVESAFKNEKPYRYFFADDAAFNPIVFAQNILDSYHFKTTRDNETVYVYDDKKGIYVPNGEVFVKESMANILGLETRAHYYNDVIFYVKGKTYFDRPEQPENKIACLNGILDVATGKTEPFSATTFITIHIPVNYDPSAQCPTIVKFLNDVFGIDSLTVLQEAIGYCLLQDMPFHKAVMLVGEGNNGKSTFLALLRAFLGKNNVSDVSLQNLCINRFASAQLHNKLANIYADIPDTKLGNTGMFKMLTGNDTISAEEKFKQPFNFRNIAKLWFSANKIPETVDDTTAFFRRWIIQICNNEFTRNKCDPHILKKLATPAELDGFLNYALEGLKRLLTNGHFSTTDNIEEMRSQYIRKSNSAKAYIEEKLEYCNDPKVFIKEADLYQNYILFCNLEKLPTMPKRNFTQNMHQYLAQAKQTKERLHEKTHHVWQFIHYKETVPTVPGILSNHTFDIKNPKNTEGSVTKNSMSLVCLDKPAGTVGTKVKHVKPGEPCELCKVSAVEWQIMEAEDHTRLCNGCFNQLRANGQQFTFLEDGEAEG